MAKDEKEIVVEPEVTSAEKEYEDRRAAVRKAFQALTDSLNKIIGTNEDGTPVENDNYRTGFNMLGQAEGWFNR